MTPETSLPSLISFSEASVLLLEGERKNEAAIPRSSELYQATLSSAFSGSDSCLEDEELLDGRFPLHRILLSLPL